MSQMRTFLISTIVNKGRLQCIIIIIKMMTSEHRLFWFLALGFWLTYILHYKSEYARKLHVRCVFQCTTDAIGPLFMRIPWNASHFWGHSTRAMVRASTFDTTEFRLLFFLFDFDKWAYALNVAFCLTHSVAFYLNYFPRYFSSLFFSSFFDEVILP